MIDKLKSKLGLSEPSPMKVEDEEIRSLADRIASYQIVIEILEQKRRKELVAMSRRIEAKMGRKALLDGWSYNVEEHQLEKL